MAKYHGLPYNLMVSKNLTPGEKQTLHKQAVGKHIAGKAAGRQASRAMKADTFLPLENMRAADDFPIPPSGGWGGYGPRNGVPGFGGAGGKASATGLSKALKWGGRALGGLGLAMTVMQLIDGYQEEFGGRRAAREGFEGLSKGLEAAQLQAALQAEEQTSRRVGWAEDSMREVQMGAANRQMRDEAELMGLMRDRAGELDQIAERYQPNLAEKLARLGVL